MTACWSSNSRLPRARRGRRRDPARRWWVAARMLVAIWLVAAAAGLTLVFRPAVAADAEAPTKRLQGVERAIEESRAARSRLDRKAADLAKETERIRRDLVKSAATIQTREGQISRLEARLEALESEEQETVAGLARSRDEASRVLMALQRLARHPMAAIVAHPMSPGDTVRGGILLRAAVGELERRVGTLQRQLDQLASLRGDVSERRRELSAARDALEAERSDLDAALTAKTELQRELSAKSRETAERVQRLSTEAGDLRELVARLETEARMEARAREEAAARLRISRPEGAPVVLIPPAGDDVIPITKARGRLSYPVVGHVVARYGRPTEAGLTSKGVSIETRTGAQVVAPYDGRIVFAGPFRGYGQVLITDHGEGYHTLLAGLSRIDTVVGQLVFGGEPVGVMRQSEDGKPRLYLELRRNNRPIDPLPWLTKEEVKVSG